ncbi:protein of unknown function (plasmid) [Azospirillum lipoferum 4B]|uniref:Uncharacterized protein n=1 Tax=Azospirillum lipoferum (strain 4B) TaxID=862719 RepID=G7ZE34_AZOL4|nr:protein of unknown function [Azospirillum lipoferum 4B]
MNAAVTMPLAELVPTITSKLYRGTEAVKEAAATTWFCNWMTTVAVRLSESTELVMARGPRATGWAMVGTAVAAQARPAGPMPIGAISIGPSVARITPRTAGAHRRVMAMASSWRHLWK